MTLRQFASVMARTYDIGDVLEDLGRSIAGVLHATGAGVSVADKDERLRFVCATGPDVERVEHVQNDGQAGPCVEAYHLGHPVAISDISGAEGTFGGSWEGYRSAATSVGFRAVLGVPLRTELHRIGSLDVYDRRAREWTDDDLDAAMVLADVAAGYLLRAGELHDAHQLNEQLRTAIESRDIIGQAKGILIARHGVESDAAFDMLKQQSQDRNVKLHRVAREIVADAASTSAAPPVDGRS